MNPRFKDKIAIVTGAGCVGAGWGNGRAIAVRLAEEGARVFAVDRDPERLEETLSLAGEARISIATHACNVTSSAEVAAMARACLERFGTIDILVNNVGGSAAGGPVGLAGGREPEERLPDLQERVAHDDRQAQREHCQHRLDVRLALDR